MSDEKQEQPKQGKHAKEENPDWPGTNDTGKEFDIWLAQSNKEAEGK